MIKKVILGVLALVLLVAVGGLIYLNTNLNAIVKSAIEKYGSQITQTDVTVDNVDISLSTGEGRVSGFHLGNPKSFVSARALDVGSVDIKIDKNTVMGSGPLVIDSIMVDSPRVTYEINAAGNANLKELQNNIGSASAGKTDQSKPSRNVIINNLVIERGEVTVTHALLKEQDIKTDLPRIHLTNIGKDGKGVTPQEVAKIVLGAVVREAAQSGQSKVARELVKQKIGDGATKAEESIKKAVGGLFGN